MNLVLAVDLNLSPLTETAIVISALGFILMFGIASAKGGFQDLITTTLDNDAKERERNQNSKKSSSK